MIWPLALAYMVWCGFVWRLRGGAWNEVLGFSMGTNVTRLLTGVLVAAPLAHRPVFACLLALAVPLGLIIGGWGPFHAMGSHWDQRDWYEQEPTWLDVFPRVLGMTKFSIAWDLTGMAVCGLILTGLCSLAASLSVPVWGWPHDLVLSAHVAALHLARLVPMTLGAAMGFAMVYFLARWALPWVGFPALVIFGKRICGRSACTEWSELAAGVWLGGFWLLLAA